MDNTNDINILCTHIKEYNKTRIASRNLHKQITAYSRVLIAKNTYEPIVTQNFETMVADAVLRMCLLNENGIKIDDQYMLLAHRVQDESDGHPINECISVIDLVERITLAYSSVTSASDISEVLYVVYNTFDNYEYFSGREFKDVLETVYAYMLNNLMKYLEV